MSTWKYRDDIGDINYYQHTTFDNGYGASVISHKASYGGYSRYGRKNNSGMFEVAVTHGRNLCYLTPVTSDTIGHLTFREVVKVFDQIEALPALEESECQHSNITDPDCSW